MKHPPLLSVALWSLLVALIGCNSRPADPAAIRAHPPEATAVPAARPAQAVAPALDLEETVYFLASPELEGRGVGTEGLERAADFIGEVFASAGLRPLPGLDGFYQPLQMTTATRIHPRSSLRTDEQRLTLGEDFTPTSFSAEQRFDGPLAFAGYGISSQEHGYDDYAGLNVEGRIVLAMRFEPHREDGGSRFAEADWSQEATIGRKARTAARHGAAALLLVNPPEHHGVDVLMPFASRFADHVADIPVIHITRDAADMLLSDAGHVPLAELQARIDRTGQPHSAMLDDVRIEGDVRIQRSVETVRNVAAYLPGEGELADEYIVVGAHYDHLGYGGIGSREPQSREIHPGADDNASGTAVLLELARRFAETGSPGRSIIFIAFTAEEWGLIGSQHFVNNPPLELERMVAMVNLDMVGRVRGNLLYIGGSGTARAFDPVLERATERSPLSMRRLGRGGFGASDHASFTMKRIPALFLFSGLHPEYHRPTDTADLINYTGLRHVADFTQDIVEQLAAGPRPEFAQDPGGMGLLRGLTGRGGGASLGVMPDYAPEEPVRGVRVSGVIPGSAAAEAGLQAGDVIVQFGDEPIESVQGLTEALSAARPGDVVTLRVIRDEQEMEVEATLRRRGN